MYVSRIISSSHQVYSQGTFEFIAIDILNGYSHERKHDLESFYWLLVWIVVRHTVHHYKHHQVLAYTRLFNQPNDYAAATAKQKWLCGRNPPLFIHSNGPLTNLLETLRLRFYVQQHHPIAGAIEATYDDVLDAIDDALKLPGWPEDDASVPFNSIKAIKAVHMALRSLYHIPQKTRN